ncbi:unnamed protein product [Paramecium octaurelia]|uniref:Uncharacterized protein n=1 Tax=Paramecium octaurelia TaxID=43137 RepID=A0A8S1U9S4_PAROT|nr:unnamed protein product [Paramecium octaurelia]
MTLQITLFLKREKYRQLGLQIISIEWKKQGGTTRQMSNSKVKGFSQNYFILLFIFRKTEVLSFYIWSIRSIQTQNFNLEQIIMIIINSSINSSQYLEIHNAKTQKCQIQQDVSKGGILKTFCLLTDRHKQNDCLQWENYFHAKNIIQNLVWRFTCRNYEMLKDKVNQPDQLYLYFKNIFY